MKKFLLFILIAAVYVLHQDYWNWKASAPMVFGFLPVGLAYQAGYSIVCAILMAVLVKMVWPGHLDAEENPTSDKNRGGHS